MEEIKVEPSPPGTRSFRGFLFHPWTINAIVALMFDGFFFFLHQEYFFPLDEHNDLSFQLTGEIIALVIAGFCVILVAALADREDQVWTSSWPLRFRRMLSVPIFALCSLAFFWREFFDGDRRFMFSQVILCISVCMGIELVLLLVRRKLTG